MKDALLYYDGMVKDVKQHYFSELISALSSSPYLNLYKLYYLGKCLSDFLMWYVCVCDVFLTAHCLMVVFCVII